MCIYVYNTQDICVCVYKLKWYFCNLAYSTYSKARMSATSRDKELLQEPLKSLMLMLALFIYTQSTLYTMLYSVIYTIIYTIICLQYTPT